MKPTIKFHIDELYLNRTVSHDSEWTLDYLMAWIHDMLLNPRLLELRIVPPSDTSSRIALRLCQ